MEVAGQPATFEENNSARALLPLSTHVRMWMVILIVFGVMFLIVVPGLVLGVVTKQLLWGFSLCGLIVAVISLFASFYYHLDRRD